jgi:hypothetical protein
LLIAEVNCVENEFYHVKDEKCVAVCVDFNTIVREEFGVTAELVDVDSKSLKVCHRFVQDLLTLDAVLIKDSDVREPICSRRIECHLQVEASCRFAKQHLKMVIYLALKASDICVLRIDVEKVS